MHLIRTLKDVSFVSLLVREWRSLGREELSFDLLDLRIEHGNISVKWSPIRWLYIIYSISNTAELLPWPCSLARQPWRRLPLCPCLPLLIILFRFIFCSTRNPKSVKCNWKHSNELPLHTSCSHCERKGGWTYCPRLHLHADCLCLLSLRWRAKLKTTSLNISVCVCKEKP